MSCGSRLMVEFEVLEVLGKGGFGDVIKVINTCTVHVHYIYMYMYMYSTCISFNLLHNLLAF